MSINNPWLVDAIAVRDGQSGGVQHLDPLLQRCAGILLMGEYSRDDTNNQIHARAGRLSQLEMRHRRRVKASCQYPDLMRPDR